MQYWIKSGRAESEDRLQQWKEAVELQEKYALKVRHNRGLARKQACGRFRFQPARAASEKLSRLAAARLPPNARDTISPRTNA